MYNRLTSSRRHLIESRAHALRSNQTFSETKLWQALRAGKLGTTFRRQVPVLDRYSEQAAPARLQAGDARADKLECEARILLI